MDLIIGGAYQGKLEYAFKTYNLTEADVHFCKEDAPMCFDKKCIYGIEEFVLYCLKNNVSAKAVLDENREKWENSVIVCREIFSGIVPIDPVLRAWRDETGRVLTALSQDAVSVTRLFCGIPQKLK